MFIEREVLISALKATIDGCTPIHDISQNAKVPLQLTREILRRNCALGIVHLEDESVRFIGDQRIRVAVKALEMGADIERVCSLLTWTEFEDVSVMAFESNNYSVKKHLRFSWFERRWEVDIVGCKEPMVISVDCKHWLRGWSTSATVKATEMQVKRTQALVEASSTLRGKMMLGGWQRAIFIPVILSLNPGSFKFYKETPIVPILQLQGFLREILAYVTTLTHFTKFFPEVDRI